MTTTDTPRTDAVVSEPCAIHQVMQKWEKIIENSRQLERELSASKAEVEFWKAEFWKSEESEAKLEAEVERLNELLNRAINEIEKTPFHTPKLTAFTAHRLADRYREKMTNNSTKPADNQ